MYQEDSKPWRRKDDEFKVVDTKTQKRTQKKNASLSQKNKILSVLIRKFSNIEFI